MTTEERIVIANRVLANRGVNDEDMKQDVYLAALESDVETYHQLYTNLNRLVLRIKEQEEKEKVYDYLKTTDTYHQQLPINDEQLKILFDAAQLSKRQREVLYKRYFQCKSFHEIGREKDVMWVRIMQIERDALRKLRGTCLRKRWIYNEFWEFFNMTL